MAAQGSAQPFHWHYGDLDDKSTVHGRRLLAVVIIFSVTLFSALACLFFRWACRHRPSASATDGHHLAGDGLDVETIASFPVTLFKRSQDEVVCSICLGVLVDGDKVKVLPACNHTFHLECVDEWLRTQGSCPLCRALLRRPPTLVDPAQVV